MNKDVTWDCVFFYYLSTWKAILKWAPYNVTFQNETHAQYLGGLIEQDDCVVKLTLCIFDYNCCATSVHLSVYKP